jgi:hypothetical protein
MWIHAVPQKGGYLQSPSSRGRVGSAVLGNAQMRQRNLSWLGQIIMFLGFLALAPKPPFPASGGTRQRVLGA